MWKQLTQKARKAIFLAHEEAERLGYNHVGTEHLLLAILREEDCVAAMVLERIGLDIGTVRVAVMSKLTRGSEGLDELQLTPEAKHAIDSAFDEARLNKEDWVGTEHLLIGLAHEIGGTAAVVLNELGAGVLEIRNQLRHIKAGTLPFERINENASTAVHASMI